MNVRLSGTKPDVVRDIDGKRVYVENMDRPRSASGRVVLAGLDFCGG